MKVRLNIDKNCIETEVTVLAEKIDNEVNDIMNFLTEKSCGKRPGITGKKNDRMVILNPEDIINVYSQKGKTYADTYEDKYEIKMKLYEAEHLLPSEKFIRISKSEIINLKNVKYFEAGFTGTIMVLFKNEKRTFVSRRFVKSLKERLGV